MKKILQIQVLVLLLNAIFSQNIVAQKKNSSEALVNFTAAFIETVVALENYKEILETEAVNYIMANHPEYTQFRLQIIHGVYEGTHKRSDQSGVSVIPFGFTLLENANITTTKKVLFMFTSPGWINENGINFSFIKWEFMTKDQWTNLITSFANLNSPAEEIKEDFMVPVYEKVRGKANEGRTDIVIVNNRNDEGKRMYQKTSESVHVNDLVIGKYGFHIWAGSSSPGIIEKVIYPFYRIQGDDYLIADFSETMKIFSNEKTLGLFFKEIGETKLMTRNTLNTIHDFMNTIPFGLISE